ncbi:MAG TPA: hypothetical protein VM198_05035 [Longimicrobiales bacterium]|nr:hypothetical protein [Longimicrobiales bacterium]
MDDDDKLLQEVRGDSLTGAIESLTRNMIWAHQLRVAEPKRVARLRRRVGWRSMAAAVLFFASLAVLFLALSDQIWWLVAYAGLVLYLAWSYHRLSDGTARLLSRSVWVTSDDVDAWQVWVAAIASGQVVPDWVAKALRRSIGSDEDAETPG